MTKYMNGENQRAGWITRGQGRNGETDRDAQATWLAACMLNKVAGTIYQARKLASY